MSIRTRALLPVLLTWVGPAFAPAQDRRPPDRPASPVAVVEDGEPTAHALGGEDWTRSDGRVVLRGIGRVHAADLGFGAGAARADLELSIDALDGSAASVVVGGSSHLGLDGRTGQLFVEGPRFGGATRLLGPASERITPGRPFRIALERRGDRLTMAIDGRTIVDEPVGNGPLGSIGLRPHRGTLRVRSWTMSGDLSDATPHALLPGSTTVFASGQDGYRSFRIPAIVRATGGDLLAFAEGRVHGASDSGDIDLVMKRSSDGGRTWSALQVVASHGDGVIGNPTPVVDARSGDVVLLAVLQPAGCTEHDIRAGVRGDREPCVLRSMDDGRTWSTPRALGTTCDRPDWRWYATGPCHAIQLRHGEHAGRIVVPANHSTDGGESNAFLSAHVLLSDDEGHTWRIGALDDADVASPELNPNESSVVELADGRLLFNCRNHGATSPATRLTTSSVDGGESFVAPYRPEPRLVAPVCQASLAAVSVRSADGATSELVVFCGPSERSQRARLRLRTSPDGGRTWRVGPLLYDGAAAYSDLVVLDDDRLGCLFEADGYGRIAFCAVPIADVVQAAD